MALKCVVDVRLLRRQASTIGTLQEDARESSDPERERESEHLAGVWNLLHSILDELVSGGECVLVKRGKDGGGKGG